MYEVTFDGQVYDYKYRFEYFVKFSGNEEDFIDNPLVDQLHEKLSKFCNDKHDVIFECQHWPDVLFFYTNDAWDNISLQQIIKSVIKDYIIF